MKRVCLRIGILLLCVALLAACGRIPTSPDESVPQDVSLTSTTTSESTTTTTVEQTTTTTTATTTSTTSTTSTTTTTATTTTTTTTTSTTLTSSYDQTSISTAGPEDDPPQEKRQFRYAFDGQDVLFSYTGGVYEELKLLWCYEGIATAGEKVIAKVSAKKGYVQSVYFEEELADEPDAFGMEARQKLLEKMPDVEEVQKKTNFIGTGYAPGTKALPYVQASIGLTDQKINVVCYWKGAVYNGTLRMTNFYVKEDWTFMKNPTVVEEGTLDFLYPRWV